MRVSVFALRRVAMASALALGVAACGDDGVGPDDDHVDEVEGIELVLNGQTIASYDADTGAWTGELEVGVGEETAHITVNFVSHDGDVVVEENTYLEVQISNEAIAEWEQDTPGEFGGHLHGVSAGETDVVFRLMHGAVGAGHADFVSAAVHAHVEG